ncbi:MAG: metX [Chloroflexi bacterium]|nr:metX [Chloroflexota bacterium]
MRAGRTAAIAHPAGEAPTRRTADGVRPAARAALAADRSSRVAGRGRTGAGPRPSGLGTGRIESLDLGPFALDSGQQLPSLAVAFRHDGPGPDTAPQVLVVHALTGSADAAGSWWEPVVGPGRALDTTRVGVLCANLLGGCYGTTGPTSVDAATGLPYGDAFPLVTPRDQARAQWALLDALGFERLALVTGGSLGGMVALEVVAERPRATSVAVPIAAPLAVSGLALAWNEIQLELVERYGEEGLDLARRLAMTTYRSEADFDGRFGRARETDGQFSVASYLAHQGRKLVDRFDSTTYCTLVRAMDHHDLGAGRGSVAAALAPLADAGVRLTAVGIEGDILYGPRQVRALVAACQRAGVSARYREITTSKGHDAFLVEWDQLGRILGEALGEALAVR